MISINEEINKLQTILSAEDFEKVKYTLTKAYFGDCNVDVRDENIQRIITLLGG